MPIVPILIAIAILVMVLELTTPFSFVTILVLAFATIALWNLIYIPAFSIAKSKPIAALLSAAIVGVCGYFFMNYMLKATY